METLGRWSSLAKTSASHAEDRGFESLPAHQILLRLSDFEAETSNGGVEFTEMPTVLLVRKSLSQTNNPYFTFAS